MLLRAFSHSLQAQIEHRKHFYKSAVLVREGILVLHGDELGADLTQTLAEIDRRMLDFVVGLDTEFSELMDGSHLYTPQVQVEEVVLADAKKKLVLDTVRTSTRSRRPRRSSSSPRSSPTAAGWCCSSTGRRARARR